MAGRGMVNMGQVVRERHGDDVVGFGGHRGSVVAAQRWGRAAAADAGARRTG